MIKLYIYIVQFAELGSAFMLSGCWNRKLKTLKSKKAIDEWQSTNNMLCGCMRYPCKWFGLFIVEDF